MLRKEPDHRTITTLLLCPLHACSFSPQGMGTERSSSARLCSYPPTRAHQDALFTPASTVSSCAFCEQEGHPTASFSRLSVFQLLLGGGLVDPQMRASNEHLLSVRVPRAGGRLGRPPPPSNLTFPQFRGHLVKPPPSSLRTPPGNRSRVWSDAAADYETLQCTQRCPGSPRPVCGTGDGR